MAIIIVVVINSTASVDPSVADPATPSIYFCGNSLGRYLSSMNNNIYY